MDLRSNLNKRVAPPSSTRRRAGSASRKALLDALAENERLAKAGESSFRAANALGLHFDQRSARRAQLHYDNAAASRAGVNILDPEACFSILSNHPFTQRGVCYPTVHHFVMAERFKNSPIEHEIPQAASLWELDRLVEMGEKNGWERPDWPQVRLNALVIGTFLKFRQNQDIMKILIRTKQRTIVADNLPPHYRDWVAHEKVIKAEGEATTTAVAAPPASSSSSSARLPSIHRTAQGFLQQQERAKDASVQVAGSTCKNLGGAVLMSLRKKLAIAFQQDEKARIKKRQMEILAAQLEEKRKQDEAKAKKLQQQQQAQAQAQRGRTPSPSGSRPGTRDGGSPRR